MTLKEVTLYTDGSSIQNGFQGAGGYCAILVSGTHERVISGGLKEATNNQAELMAVISGLQALKYPCQVLIVTDSKYVSEGSEKWLADWKRRGWRTADGSPVKNKGLWMQLDALLHRHTITWQWVHGHTGHPYNERCDLIAAREARSI
jgi:ribonuclease HI